MPCPCSMSGLGSLVGAKLGVCHRCIAIAAAGSIAGWTVAQALQRAGAPRFVRGPVRLTSIALSLLLAAHVFAYALRRRTTSFGAPVPAPFDHGGGALSGPPAGRPSEGPDLPAAGHGTAGDQ